MTVKNGNELANKNKLILLFERLLMYYISGIAFFVLRETDE